jgi:hypothetical protein
VTVKLAYQLLVAAAMILGAAAIMRGCVRDRHWWTAATCAPWVVGGAVIALRSLNLIALF